MPLTQAEKDALVAQAATFTTCVGALVADPAPAQTIDLFTVSAASITAGQSITLNWATSNATAVRLNGAAVSASGSQTLSPTADTTYTLEADGSAATVSKSVSVAVAQPAPTPVPANANADADFAARLAALGSNLVRAFDFNDPSSLTGAGINLLLGEDPVTHAATANSPLLDTEVKASGASSLRFDLVPFVSSGGNQAGAWEGNFSGDNSVQFGAGEEFYVQWRQRFDANMVSTVFYEGVLTGPGEEWVRVNDAGGNALPITRLTPGTVSIPSTTAWTDIFGGHGWAIRLEDGQGNFIGYGLVYGARVLAGTTEVDYFLTQGTDTGVAVAYKGWPQQGIKQVDFVVGSVWNGQSYGSSEVNKIVTTTDGPWRIPQWYNSYPGMGPSMNPRGAGGEYLIQNGDYWCDANAPGTANAGGVVPAARAFVWVPDEWLTFQVRIKVPTYNATSGFYEGGELQACVARAAQPSQVFFDWRPGVSGYPTSGHTLYTGGLPYGKVLFFPWLTSKDARQDHPVCRTWYDEAIVARRPINDPGFGVPPAALQAASAPSLPAWRVGKTAGQWYSLPNTANMAPATQSPSSGKVNTTTGLATGQLPGVNGDVIDAWNGLCASPDHWYSAAASGDQTWFNGTYRLRLDWDAPQWETLDIGSNGDAVNVTAPYYSDGRPTGRHTYLSQVFIPGRFCTDGKDRIMAVGCDATVGANLAQIPDARGRWNTVDGFRVADKQWDAGGTYADVPGANGYRSIACDSRDGAIYAALDRFVHKYNLATNTWDVLVYWGWTDVPGATTMLPWNIFTPSIVDVKRNRVVCLHHGYPDDTNSGGASKPRFQRVLIAPRAQCVVDNVYITGLPTYYYGTCVINFAHDTDADKYYVMVWTGDLTNGPAPRLFRIDNPDGVGGTTNAVELAQSPSWPVWSLENRFAYYARYKCLMYQSRFADNAAFYPTV